MGQVVNLPLNLNNKRKRNIDPNARNVVFELLLKKTEKERLAVKAEAMGVSISDLLRYGAFGTEGLRVDPKIGQVREMLAPTMNDVGGMVANLNQIAKHLNRLHLMNLPLNEVEVRDDLDALLVEMRAIRDELGDQILAIKKLI